MRRSVLPSTDWKTSALVGPPLLPWDLETSVVPSGDSSGKSPAAVTRRAARPNGAVVAVGLGGVVVGRASAVTLCGGVGDGAVAAFVQAEKKSAATRSAGERPVVEVYVRCTSRTSI